MIVMFFVLPPKSEMSLSSKKKVFGHTYLIPNLIDMDARGMRFIR